MIHLVELFCDLGFSLFSFLLYSLLALKKAMSTAVTSTSPTPAASPTTPWKRFADAPLLVSKRPKESPAHRGVLHADEPLSFPELHRRMWEPVSPVMAAGKHREGYPVIPGGGEGDVGKNKAPAAASAEGEGSVAACPRVRRRPTRILIPETDVGSGFGEVGKVDSDGEFQAEGCCYGVACRRGNRRVMEDGYGVKTNIRGDSKQAYFGVFDGHGGRAAVDYVSEKLGENIIAALGDLDQKGNGDPEKAIVEGYLTTDKEFLSQEVASGVCAATVLLKDGELHAANVGDCRVVMSRKGVATALTSDHRPEREDERIRIENSGGYISFHHGVLRVQGSLAISRAIGDLHVKDWITSMPETTRLRLTSDCEFLIIASDGLWDKVSNQEAVDAVAKDENFLQSSKKLVDLSYSRGSRDDITVMVVDLRGFAHGGD
uniref:protein-serine/threonine phosphatase n=1 Tax=Anthurium amnicola TaxID=1678845 RepID=A0A1D1XMV2_9ARAE